MPERTASLNVARLRELRVARHLTVEELATAAGLTRQAIYVLESGQRPDPLWSTVQALADALDVSTEELRA